MQADPQSAGWSRRSRLELAVAEPERIAGRLITHFASNDAEISLIEDGASATFFYSQIIVRSRPNALVIETVAGDDVALSHMKSVAAALLIEYSDGERPQLRWTGHGAGATAFPNFREMTVERIVDVTPHMRRITLSGHNLDSRYATHGQHFKLLVPPEGVDTPEWPVPGEDGLPIWPAEDKRPKVRTLTARHVDIANGTIDVDLAMHGDLGVASKWALTTRPGDVVGIRGPIGQPVPKANWYLLVGDETALPGIARTLEHLPAGTKGVAIIEVADEGEQQSIDYEADIELRWLYRNGAEAGTTSLLVDAVRTVNIPPETLIHAAAGVEYTAFKAIRRYWRDELQLDKKHVLPVAYWRRGGAEGDAAPDNEGD